MVAKRFRIEGSIFYITSNIYNRINVFTRPSFIIPIIDSFNYYQYQYNCKLLGYVIMPDHIHVLIWPHDAEVVTDFMRDFKRFTSGRITRQAKVEESSIGFKNLRKLATRLAEQISKYGKIVFGSSVFTLKIS